MERSVRLNKQGFTLVEILIALTILLLVSLAMMQTALLAIGANMQNVMRDEAVRIAETRMNEARHLRFDESATQLVSDTADGIADAGFAIVACQNPPVSDATPYPVVIYGNFRNIAPVPFGTRRTVSVLDVDNRQVTVLVRWEYRGVCYSHQTNTLIKRRGGTT
jgi:prepilin-type N-terminal cleavage/methylation domain-containing protein